MAQIMAAPQNFNCALMLDTTNPIPVVGNQSAINQFPGFDATFDQNPPAIPQGHVSVNDNPAVANPARAFANQIADIARNNPATFNDDHIVGVHLTDDECRDKPKWLNQ
ncbi:hypothetical protein PSE_p0162 (plasmid) [Pseudovibrio sp. FO-BEG1]|nr:hypothetical protein PSE_p0162 [Pseudovibrio sp. FO-BEG1]EEA93539.1 hypothetical protein PJE062_3940 [Pseudovibrio sp. JE062]